MGADKDVAWRLVTARSKATDAHGRVKEAENKADLLRRQTRDAEAQVCDLETCAVNLSRAVGELEAELATLAAAPETPSSIPIVRVLQPDALKMFRQKQCESAGCVHARILYSDGLLAIIDYNRNLCSRCAVIVKTTGQQVL